MNKRPLAITLYAAVSLIAGASALVGMLINYRAYRAVSLLCGTAICILLILGSYYLFKESSLGWHITIFLQFVVISKSYAAILYLFINISKVTFTTENVNEYILKYGFQALLGMGILYYFLTLTTTQYFGVIQKHKLKFIRLVVPIACIVALLQFATHSIIM